MTPPDRAHWKDRTDAVVAELETFAGFSDQRLLAQLPRTRHVSKPFSLPFPVFACRYCQVSRELEAHVVDQPPHEVCRLRIASLPAAVSFFRNNGGRGSHAYHRLVEARDLRRDPWRELDPGVRHRISRWFELQEAERFVRFFHDTEFSRLEAGMAGVVLTDRRLVCKLHGQCDGYPLSRSGRIELMQKGEITIAHIYHEGYPPAVVKLDQNGAERLVQDLKQLGCRWAVVT